MNSDLHSDVPAFLQDEIRARGRRPRIALMGEFSAGKSTLANLMIGSDPLPVQVVATQLPPVWVTFGDGPARLVDLEGGETEVDLASSRKVDPAHCALVRAEAGEDILRLCDIIDMPGISDPNMPSAVWERILPLADAVVWCSPATQAWRQSEAAVWETVPPEIRARSLLLLTRSDMLMSDADKARVLKRVRAETDGLFQGVCMISLTGARDAGDCARAWENSGAGDFVAAFLDVVARLRTELDSGDPGIDFGFNDVDKDASDIRTEGEGADSDSPESAVGVVDDVSNLSETAPADVPVDFAPKFS